MIKESSESMNFRMSEHPFQQQGYSLIFQDSNTGVRTLFIASLCPLGQDY